MIELGPFAVYFFTLHINNEVLSLGMLSVVWYANGNIFTRELFHLEATFRKVTYNDQIYVWVLGFEVNKLYYKLKPIIVKLWKVRKGQ